MKKKNEIIRLVIKGILITGGIVIATTSPSFVSQVLPKLLKQASYKIKSRKDKKKVYDVFYRMRKNGLLRYENRNGQLFISLTEEGRKRAGKYQIDDLKIKNLKRWDRKWRILIFDIQNKNRAKREALRGKIKQLGLYQLQKSVWVYPYDFQNEIDLLRSFFGLTNDEMKVVVASEIEDDKNIKTFFGIK